MQRLGDFYREKILSRDDLEEIFLPPLFFGDQVTIEKKLFGVKLKVGRREMDCRSEEEARYCKVFCEACLSEVMIPQDMEYVKSILPALEELKAKHDRLLIKWMDGLLSKNLRRKFFLRAWDKVMWEPKQKSGEENL